MNDKTIADLGNPEVLKIEKAMRMYKNDSCVK